MPRFSRPLRRDTVQGILDGTIKECPVPDQPAVGDTVTFFSARPIPGIPDATEDVAEPNAITAHVHVSEVKPGPNMVLPWLVRWDAYGSAGWAGA
jgi:hypothetical protein